MILVAATDGAGADTARTVARRLASLRVERALAAARSDYAKSAFLRCEERLGFAEREWRGALEDADDFRQMKRLHQWIGMCQLSRGATAKAKRSFRTAGALPGAAPDPKIFPPAAIDLYGASAAADTQRCALALPDGVDAVSIDGAPARAGTSVAIGEHYVSWDAGVRRSERLEISEDCRLVLPPEPPERLSLALLDEEAADGALLEELRRSAGASALSIAPRTEAGGPPSLVIGGAPAPAPAREAKPDDPSWAGSWWFWGLVGAAVASAALVPALISSREERERVVLSF